MAGAGGVVQEAAVDMTPESTAPKARSASHSLSSSNQSGGSRKGRSAEPGIDLVMDGIDRASLSMPPPASKPLNKPTGPRRLSISLMAGDGFKTQADLQQMEDRTVTEESDKTPNLNSLDARGTVPYTSLTLTEPLLKASRQNGATIDHESKRLSFSSLFSMGSAIHGGNAGGVSGAQSTASSNAGSIKSAYAEQGNGAVAPSPTHIKGEPPSKASAAVDPVSVTTLSHASTPKSAPINIGPATGYKDAANSVLPSRPPNMPRQSRSKTQQRNGASTAGSSTSPSAGDRGRAQTLGKIGVCALDVKARSKPSRNILTRLQHNGEFDVVVFGDKVILDEDVENWPLCDFLISFFSEGFPLDKAIAYTDLRKPFCINDLPMQKVLWDRRICLRILDSMGVPTPRRLEVNRDGGPTLESSQLAHHVYQMSGVKLEGSEDGRGGGLPKSEQVSLSDDGDTLIVDGLSLRKPFVEKPISGEDHNIRIYFPKEHEGGGGRRLFRKIGNKSSEWDPNLIVPRAVEESGSSYVYEQFLHVDNAEDVKAYTVGTEFCHAETRKSPVVDGLVRRNTHGKEIRYITSLTKEEALMASKIAEGFGQRICGFDLLRVGSKSYVIDVNGWSFVKDNNEYYDKCSKILKHMFVNEQLTREGKPVSTEINRDTPPDPTSTVRKPAGSHRSALKTILRSPSFSKLTSGLHSRRGEGDPSPDISLSTTPMTSPPSLDRRAEFNLPPMSTSSDDGVVSPMKLGSQLERIEAHQSLNASQSPMVSAPLPAAKHSWKLKGMVAVVRHADRTPKQKFKFTFHTQPFVDLLKGHQEEVLLKGATALESVMKAVNTAIVEGIEDGEKLKQLKTSLARKGAWAGTKVQIKPMFRKRKAEERRSWSSKDVKLVQDFLPETALALVESPSRSDSLAGITLSRFSAVENDLVIDKLQLIIKWGGEPTHAARYQSQDLGENMRNDLVLMNREALEDVRVFTSSERRVSTSAQIWAGSFLNIKDVPEDFISVRKDLLDDSNAAKDVMDGVKKKLKHLLREGHEAPAQFAWPPDAQAPYLVVRRVAELMRHHRRIMRHNFGKINGGAAASLSAVQQAADGSKASSSNDSRSMAEAKSVTSIQARWCCGEDADFFRERWEKLFQEFSDAEKVDPSKISELYDTMKFDALHNRQFLEWVFTPSPSIPESEGAAVVEAVAATLANKLGSEENPAASQSRKPSDASQKLAETAKPLSEEKAPEKVTEKASNSNLAHRIGFRRRSFMTGSPVPESSATPEPSPESYFKLFSGNAAGQSKAKQDARLCGLRELYQLAKMLFDFICPQEYGISDSEKLEIGLLTSLPLLKEIVKDLEEVQASEDGAKSFIYFTKESHIYTLLNCILEGGIKTKISRNAIPELDYLSQICFELYESEDKDASADADMYTYSIKITVTPGCHTSNPLDVVLDSKHSIGCSPRRSLTNHAPWKEVIETLREKFHTVKLPKSFLAVNLSERVEKEMQGAEGGEMGEGGREESESMDGNEGLGIRTETNA